MVNIRDFTPDDIPALQKAIDADAFHAGEWKIWHFQIPGLPTKVVEDSQGPVAFVLYTNHEQYLRVSCVWADTDPRRNARAMIKGIPLMAITAREENRIGLVIETKHDKLANFLIRVFGMRQTGNDYFLTFDRRPTCAAQVQH